MNTKKYLPVILVTSLFFLWALTSNLLQTFILHLKKACGLTHFQSAFIDGAYWKLFPVLLGKVYEILYIQLVYPSLACYFAVVLYFSFKVQLTNEPTKKTLLSAA